MERPLKILWGMVAGVVLGFLARATLGEGPAMEVLETLAHVAGQVFLRLILMVVVPLVVTSLLLGVVELGDVRRLGGIGARCLAYTLILSTISVLVGIVTVQTFRPGQLIDATVRDDLRRSMADESSRAVAHARQAKSPVEILLGLIPRNPLDAAVRALEGEMIALMVFALIVGLAITMIERETAAPLIRLAEAVLAACMKVIDFAMALAPFGVAGFLFLLVVRTGGALLTSVAGYVLCVIGGLAFQQFVVYSVVLAAVVRENPWRFYRKIREAALTAFSTASSAATLPTALRVSEEELGIPREVGRFVLTVGATGNQNGTALFEGITVLFLAQVFGVELAFGQQLLVMFVSLLAGVGTAGVPGGSIPLIVVVLQSVGIPPEGIGIILGVDRLLDMARTTLNVTGDLVIARLVAGDQLAGPGEPLPGGFAA